MRRGFRRSDGTYVRPTRIRDVGLPGKGPYTLPEPKRGALGRFGYRTALSPAERHRALDEAVAAESPRQVIGHLNLVANFNRNINPKVYEKLRQDMRYVQHKYEVQVAPGRFRSPDSLVRGNNRARSRSRSRSRSKSRSRSRSRSASRSRSRSPSVKRAGTKRRRSTRSRSVDSDDGYGGGTTVDADLLNPGT